jgi:hypothetical protein
MRPFLRYPRKRFACSLEEVEMSLLTEWLISVVLGNVIIVVTQDISAGFVLPVEAEGIAVAVTTEVVAVTTAVVGMGVGMGVVVIGTPPTGTTLLTGMLLGQMLLPQLKGSSLQEAKRLLPVMQILSILIQVILNTHQ